MRDYISIHTHRACVRFTQNIVRALPSPTTGPPAPFVPSTAIAHTAKQKSQHSRSLSLGRTRPDPRVFLFFLCCHGSDLTTSAFEFLTLRARLEHLECCDIKPPFIAYIHLFSVFSTK